MSARKLSRRLAGLALVLAAAFGGVSMASSAQAAGGHAETTAAAITTQQVEITWG